jgi:hypothetical protein
VAWKETFFHDFQWENGRETHALRILALVNKVQLNGQVLLGLLDQPLHLEVGKHQLHEVHQDFHRFDVHFGVTLHVRVLHLDGHLLPVLQRGPMDLGERGRTQRYRIERFEQIFGLKIKRE